MSTRLTGRGPALLAFVATLVALGLLCPAVVLAGIDPITDAEDRLDPTAPALVAGLQSDSAAVRARVATAYGRIQTPASVDPLLSLLGDRSPRVRTEALFVLGQLAWKPGFAGGREAEIADAVTPFLGDKSLSVRLAAIEAIGKIALERTPDLVGALLADPSARVRADALMALFRYRLVLRQRDPDRAPPDLPQEIIDQLPALAADDDAQVRRNVVYLTFPTPHSPLPNDS
jgi:HEAT repeats